MLSKSEYMMFLKHPAWLWLKKHDKANLPEPDANLQARFDEGNLFETYAEKLFPEGKRIGFKGYDEYLTMPERTQKVLDDGTKTIFQGRFEAGNITCIIDVLERVDKNTFDLTEIKASTRAKPEHVFDLAFQTVVLENAGLKIRNISVIHVNNQYVRDGDIDFKQLTATIDITDKVRKKIDDTKRHIHEALRVASLKQIPDISPRHARLGSFSEWLDIYQGLTKEFDNESIFNLTRINATTTAKLEDLDVEKVSAIPDGFKLPASQQRQVEATKSGETTIDKAKVKEFLDELEFPLHFLDYETMQSLVPPFDGLRPYQQVPTQYSVHIFDTPDAELRQEEYLYTDNSNPAESLAKQLVGHIGEKGSVLVWNQSFEKKCNELLAEFAPEIKDRILDINDRIIDLMIPFSKGWYVDKDFLGSASIKNVLPVLVPKLSYKNLNVQEGGAAQRIWMDTVLGGKNDKQKEQIFKDLLEYCRLDTLAMVEIWRVLASL